MYVLEVLLTKYKCLINAYTSKRLLPKYNPETECLKIYSIRTLEDVFN